MKKFLVILFILSFCKKEIHAQCPPGALAIEITDQTCPGGCGVLLSNWPQGVIVNIFGDVNNVLDSITSGTINSSGSAFVCVPCNVTLVFAAAVPGAQSGCVITIGTPVPIVVSNFTITSLKGNPLLNWDISFDATNVSYIVQRSNDGTTFSDIATIAGSGTESVSKNYSYTDESAGQATLYYRIKIVEPTGGIVYSSTLSVNNMANGAIKIYPNPVISNSFGLNVPIEFLPALVTVFDAQGKIVYSNKITQTSSTVNASLSSGIYALKIIGNNNISAIQKIIKK